MPDKASRANSITPAESQKKSEDDVESVEMIDLEEEEEDSSDELQKRVRFKVGGLLRVNSFCLLLDIGVCSQFGCVIFVPNFLISWNFLWFDFVL